MHRHNPALPPLLLIIQRNCGRHHHQRRHRKEPALQYHHYYFRRQHHLSKPSDINIFQRPIFYHPIGKLLSQVHYELFIASSFVIIINRIIESGCRCIDIIIIIIIIIAAASPTGRHNPTLRTSSARRQLFIFHLHYQSFEATSVVIIINGIIGRSRCCSRWLLL